MQAALASASSFCVGALPPIVLAALAPGRHLTGMIVCAPLALLGLLGGIAARIGGAPVVRGAVRVLV